MHKTTVQRQGKHLKNVWGHVDDNAVDLNQKVREIALSPKMTFFQSYASDSRISEADLWPSSEDII